ENSAELALAFIGLVDLALSRGDFSQAEVALMEAMGAAGNTGDRSLQARTELRRTRFLTMTDQAFTAEEGLERGEAAAAVRAETGDDAALAEAWVQVAFFRGGLGRDEEGDMALARARSHASRVGDRWLDPRVSELNWMLPWTGTGPRPAAEESDRARVALGGRGAQRRGQAYALP